MKKTMICLMAATLGIASLLHTAACAQDVRGELIQGAISWYNDLSTDPLPELNSEQILKLLDKQTVKIRRKEKLSGENSQIHERIVGYSLIEQPRTQIWLAALDPEFQAMDILTEFAVPATGKQTKMWYQHIALPWPIEDRHWLINVWMSTELAFASDNLIWEQNWNLADNGESIAKNLVAQGHVEGLNIDNTSKAVYLPANQGNWILFKLEENLTFLAYRVTTDPGGKIPESWIATFAMAQLGSLLNSVKAHALEMPQLYDAEQHAIMGGDGKTVLEISP